MELGFLYLKRKGINMLEVFEDGSVKTKMKGRHFGFKNSRGYMMVHNPETRKTIGVHRLVANEFVPNPNPEKFNQVNHIDGNKTNNHYTNLEWTDNSGNQKHAYVNGLNYTLPKFGSKNSQSKLNEDQVREIRKLSSNGLSQREIAKLFNVNYCTIHYIVKRKTWSHI